MTDGSGTASTTRTVILTGASRGIGHATVRRFSNEGWRIITCSRDAIPEACKADPNWTHHIPTDLTDKNSVAAFIEEANAALGKDPLNALVNNAAVSPKTSFKERLGVLNGDIDSWRQVFELNFFTPLSLSRGFAQALGRGAKGSGGAIVNITSIAGHAIHPFAGSAYSTSKAGLSALTREMAVEFAQLGVRVNAVAPGPQLLRGVPNRAHSRGANRWRRLLSDLLAHPAAKLRPHRGGLCDLAVHQHLERLPVWRVLCRCQ